MMVIFIEEVKHCSLHDNKLLYHTVDSSFQNGIVQPTIYRKQSSNTEHQKLY